MVEQYHFFLEERTTPIRLGGIRCYTATGGWVSNSKPRKFMGHETELCLIQANEQGRNR